MWRPESAQAQYIYYMGLQMLTRNQYAQLIPDHWKPEIQSKNEIR